MPVDCDELDAVTEIIRNLRDWANALDGASLPRADRAGLAGEVAFEALAMDVAAIRRHLPRVMNDLRLLGRFAEAVLVHHAPSDEGYRPWSIADAVARWGVERREHHRFVYPDDDGEPTAVDVLPVREWYDPLITRAQAADRAGVTLRQIQRWEKAGELTLAAKSRGPRGSVLTWFYASAVDAAAKTMRDRQLFPSDDPTHR